MPVDRGRVFAVVAVWTIVLLVIGTLTIGMTESMSSRRYDFQESFVLKPRSGAFIQLEVVAKAGGVLRGYEAPPKTFDELVLTLHPLKALQPGQGAGEMTINLSQPGYRYAARDGEYYLEREYVTAQVMLDWMKEAGVDVQQTAVREEAAALIDAANRARKIRPRDAIRQADSSFDLFQTGSRHDIEGFDKAYAIHWSVVGVIWFLGAGLAFVTRRRWAPLKNRREWKPGDDISGFVCAIVAVVMLCLAMIIPGILLAVSETDRGTNAAGITFLIGITLAAIFGLLGHHFRMGRFSAAFALVIGIGVFGLLFLRGASHGSPQEHNPTALTDGPNVPHITGRQGKLPSADPVNLPRLAGPATGLDVLKIPVGTWDVVRTIRQHPTLTPGTKVNGKMSFRTVLDDRFVTMAVRYDNGDHWLLIQGYDEKKDEYPTWIFPPQGPVVHVRKKWDEKSRMLVPIGQDGGPVDNDVVGRMIDDDTMEARFVMRDRDGRVRMDSLQVSTRTSKEPSDDVMRNVDRRNPNGPAELAAYDGFVGEFDFELMDSMADDKSWMPAGHSRTQWILDGRFILRETFDPDDKLNVIGLKTYDPDARSYREWHFFATGAWMEVRATWDEDTKRFSYQGTVNDGATLAGVEFPTSKGYEWTAIFKDESGGVMADLSARVNRKP